MAHNAKKRAKAQELYRAGHSFAEIRAAVKVSKPTLMKWAKEDCWKKGEALPELAQKEADTLLAEAERLGLTKAYFLGKIKELCEATRPVLVKPSKAEQEKAKAEGDDSSGSYVEQVPDYAAISDGLTHAERIVPGLKQAEKVEDNRFTDLMEWIRGQ